jgi:hypothetical protein
MPSRSTYRGARRNCVAAGTTAAVISILSIGQSIAGPAAISLLSAPRPIETPNYSRVACTPAHQTYCETYAVDNCSKMQKSNYASCYALVKKTCLDACQ